MLFGTVSTGALERARVVRLGMCWDWYEIEWPQKPGYDPRESPVFVTGGTIGTGGGVYVSRGLNLDRRAIRKRDRQLHLQSFRRFAETRDNSICRIWISKEANFRLLRALSPTTPTVANGIWYLKRWGLRFEAALLRFLRRLLDVTPTNMLLAVGKGKCQGSALHTRRWKKFFLTKRWREPRKG